MSYVPSSFYVLRDPAIAECWVREIWMAPTAGHLGSSRFVEWTNSLKEAMRGTVFTQEAVRANLLARHIQVEICDFDAEQIRTCNLAPDAGRKGDA